VSPSRFHDHRVQALPAPMLRYPSRRSLPRRQEPYDLSHHSLSLVRLEHELGVRGALQDDECLRRRHPLIGGPNAREPTAAGAVGASSLVTMNSVRALIFPGALPASAPSNTSRPISSGPTAAAA
jgi:hypothetical protein